MKHLMVIFMKKILKILIFFFTQRNIKEERDYIDKTNMNRYKKKIDKMQNFLAIIIPQYKINEDKTSLIDINIWGDNGYYFNGKIITSKGSTPSFIIPISEDKRLFINLIYREIDKDNKENNINSYIKFIDVPKRFQSITSSIDNLSATDIEI